MSSPPKVNYRAIAQLKSFEELLERRRRFGRVALGGAILWFGGFILLTCYAHSFMGTLIVPGLSVAYVLGLSQFVMVWAITAAYLHASTKTFEPLQEQVVAHELAMEPAA
jgi:uncharacterized membrane protein (DUF485 family)